MGRADYQRHENVRLGRNNSERDPFTFAASTNLERKQINRMIAVLKEAKSERSEQMFLAKLTEVFKGTRDLYRSRVL